MKSGRPFGGSYRGAAPCKDCTERFLTCQDRCPKDARGEYGYASWKLTLAEISKKRKEYNEEIRNYKNRRM